MHDLACMGRLKTKVKVVSCMILQCSCAFNFDTIFCKAKKGMILTHIINFFSNEFDKKFSFGL